MDSVLYPLVAVVATVALVYKLPALRRDPRSPTRRAFICMLACLVWAPTLNTPAVYVAFDEFVGVPNVARLLAHLGIMGFGASVQALLLHWTVSRPPRRSTWGRLALYALAAIVMAVLFALAPVDEDTTEFTARYGDAPYVAEYMTVYTGYFAFALGDVLRLSWQYAKLATGPFMRLGFRLAAVGAGFGLAYCVEKLAYVTTRRAGIELVPQAVQEQISPLLCGPGALLLLVGFTIPSWGPRAASARESVQRYTTYRRLRPLWQLLYAATPEIALETPTGRADLIRLRDLEYRLIRRVVEIRDGWLALRPYLSAAAAETARRLGDQAGLTGERLQATVDAALLAEAARTKAAGRHPAAPHHTEAGGGSAIEDETTSLLRIAGALNSPIVRATLAAQQDRHESQSTVV